MWSIPISVGMLAAVTLVCSNARAELPTGFAYLADVDPSILQDIRYAGPHNFVGRRIAGYEASECVLTEKAARALARVQTELATRKLSVAVWDCYRPARAVAEFARWSRNPSDVRMKAEFYPRTDKTRLFALGYIAAESAHSRGSTVDLGIAPAGVSWPPPYDPAAPLQPCTARKGERFDDGAIDFGTGYDCLDVLAATTHTGIGEQAQANRLLLRDLMQSAGFRPYRREWWHFELLDEPFRNQRFDFPILPRQGR